MTHFNSSNETGRSMVEMLAVLAIVGILSIGGIASFKIAMTKLRTNELLSEANKRAISVAEQINLNGIAPSLNDIFKNNEFIWGSFETTVYDAIGENVWVKADPQFTLSITGVPGDICEKLQDNLEPNIKNFTPEVCDLENLNNVKLTYNNDLSTEDIDDSHCDAGEFVVDANGERKCCRGYRVDGNNWNGYSGTQCCAKNQSVNRHGKCVECGRGKYYNMLYADFHGKDNGAEACGKRCTKNEDCTPDKFCFMDPYATQANSAVDPIVGTCLSAAEFGGIVTADIVIDGESAGRWIGPKNDTFDWWSARNFCLRFGKVDLPTRKQICGFNVPNGGTCPTPLRKAIEGRLSSQQTTPHFWLEETGTGKAYYVDPSRYRYVVKIPPESTARARSAGVVCGPVSPDLDFE